MGPPALSRFHSELCTQPIAIIIRLEFRQESGLSSEYAPVKESGRQLG
jgi:hypothetical protein